MVTVQGSARLRLPDGTIYEVGFAGTNGRPYVSPGRQMLADGVISRDQLSLNGLGQYFAEHPAQMDKYLWLTTFFTKRPGGPYEKLNVPVTPMSTIAADKEVYPRAMPALLVAAIPMGSTAERLLSGFMLDQDTGGAIGRKPSSWPDGSCTRESFTTSRCGSDGGLLTIRFRSCNGLFRQMYQGAARRIRCNMPRRGSFSIVNHRVCRRQYVSGGRSCVSFREIGVHPR